MQVEIAFMFHQGTLFGDMAAEDMGGCGVSHLSPQGHPQPPPPSCIHRKCQSSHKQITEGYCMNPGRNKWVCKPCMDDYDRFIVWDKKKRDDEWDKAVKNGWLRK